MKTAVTVINTVQTGMDNYKDVKDTKVFEDISTLKEIKEWIISASRKYNKSFTTQVDDIGLGFVDFSNVE